MSQDIYNAPLVAPSKISFAFFLKSTNPKESLLQSMAGTASGMEVQTKLHLIQETTHQKMFRLQILATSFPPNPTHMILSVTSEIFNQVKLEQREMKLELTCPNVTHETASTDWFSPQTLSTGELLTTIDQLQRGFGELPRFRDTYAGEPTDLICAFKFRV